MRIIGGLYRGKKLLSPRSANIRPTADQAREAVFNILSSRLDKPWNELSMADVFTGSGAFALEAVSRGVRDATLVDLDLTDAARNAALFPAEKGKIRLLKADAARLPAAPTPFDLIFLDAPYHKGLSEKALASLSKQNWIGPDSLCVVEQARDEKLLLPASLEIVDERAYVIARFLFIRQQSA